MPYPGLLAKPYPSGEHTFPTRMAGGLRVSDILAQADAMPLTTLDTRSALVMIDLQKGIARLPTITPASEIISRAARLATAFRAANLPVIWVRVTGRAPGRVDLKRPDAVFDAEFCELADDLHRQPQDRVLDKQRFGAFIGTTLDDDLRSLDITQVVLGGISTSSGVESTARSAYDAGYNLSLVTDVMTDTHAEAHRHAVNVQFPKLGETGELPQMLKLLER